MENSLFCVQCHKGQFKKSDTNPSPTNLSNTQKKNLLKVPSCLGQLSNNLRLLKT